MVFLPGFFSLLSLPFVTAKMYEERFSQFCQKNFATLCHIWEVSLESCKHKVTVEWNESFYSLDIVYFSIGPLKENYYFKPALKIILIRYCGLQVCSEAVGTHRCFYLSWEDSLVVITGFKCLWILLWIDWYHPIILSPQGR